MIKKYLIAEYFTFFTPENSFAVTQIEIFNFLVRNLTKEFTYSSFRKKMCLKSYVQAVRFIRIFLNDHAKQKIKV